MPHAGLMIERAMGDEEGPFLRAKLHIRSGKRRLREGKISAGLLTLYDALSAALEWYVASENRRKSLNIQKNENLNNERDILSILVRSKIIDGKFDYDSFDKLIDRAINEDILDFDYSELLLQYESLMKQLGIMPFDESELPKERPDTF
ncbi:MAG: hypothetical protein N3A59_05510 [Thermodesulfovibrionales bacterium]|nr:hypothetical protein [Thermodesulfovibrionales bacterium]